MPAAVVPGGPEAAWAGASPPCLRHATPRSWCDVLPTHTPTQGQHGVPCVRRCSKWATAAATSFPVRGFGRIRLAPRSTVTILPPLLLLTYCLLLVDFKKIDFMF